jgi:hypothetical protein
MRYQDYIDRGFKRINLDDAVEFRNTGYGGFILYKKIRKGVSIQVCSGDLHEPKLFIEKKGACILILPVTEADLLKLKD